MAQWNNGESLHLKGFTVRTRDQQKKAIVNLYLEDTGFYWHPNVLVISVK